MSLLAVVKREDFLPAAYRALAFVDTEIPLPTTDGAGESMLAPKVEARLLQEMSIAHHETVLEVGAGRFDPGEARRVASQVEVHELSPVA